MTDLPLGAKLGNLISTEKDPARRAKLEEIREWARRVVPDFQTACNEILQARASLSLQPYAGVDTLAERAKKLRAASDALYYLSERGAAGVLRAKLGREVEHGRALELVLDLCGVDVTPAKSSS